MALKATFQDGRVLCSTCSSPINPDENVCGGCGETLQGDFEAFICPSCNLVVPSASDQCYNCGLRLKSGGENNGSLNNKGFLKRLLTWNEKSKVVRKKVVTPTIQKAEIERHVKEEAKAEKEESIKGLVDTFKAVINTRKRKLRGIHYMSTEELRRTKEEERRSLRQFGDLVEKVEGLFKDVWDKHNIELHDKDEKAKKAAEEMTNEKEEELKVQLEELMKEKETFKNGLEKQMERMNSLSNELEEKGNEIEEKENEIEDITVKKEHLEEANDKLTDLHGEIKDMLKVLDDLLGRLSENEIELFARSEDYRRYEMLLKKFAI